MFVTQTPHDEIFAQQTRARAACPSVSSPASCSQGFQFHQATNKQSSTIQSRMHLHDTVSAPVANGTLNICPEHFLLLIFQKACIPEPTGKPTCIVLHRGSISLSLFFLFFLLPFHHLHHIITEHGALLTGHGSWMALRVKCSTS